MAKRASVFMAEESFARLRRKIAEIEGKPTPSCDRRTLLPFGIEPLDRLLAGGLRRDALHEIRGETTRDSIAAGGFAIALLARLATHKETEKTPRPFLLVFEARALDEAGELYGPGIGHLGLDPRQLVIVRTRRPSETLWVFEEALRCRGVAAVLAEIRGHPRQLDLTASRRLALRARDNGVMGLLLRQAASAEPGGSATRWQVSPRPVAPLDDFPAGIGRPVWRLALERNRAGPLGTFDLEWNHDTRAFASATPIRPALSLARTPLSGNRPNPSAKTGAVVALRRAS